jgi:hypothetical protein
VPRRSPSPGYLAVDPSTGAAHRLSTPAGINTLIATPSGQLRAVSFFAHSWSDDGGAGWHRRALGLVGNEIPELDPPPPTPSMPFSSAAMAPPCSRGPRC